MARSVLGYRVFRLRRLIVVCLGLLSAGIAAGMWLVPGTSAVQVVVGIGLFSLLAMAHLAIILFWPQDTVEPLASAIGFAAVLPAALPAIATFAETPAELFTLIGLATAFLPVLWGFGIRILGWLILKPLDMLHRKDVALQFAATLPMDMPAARACFFFAPHDKRLNAVSGPVEWDGFITETNTRREVGPKSGQISTTTFANRIRILEETETTQGLLVQWPGPDGAILATAVVHQSLRPSGTTTILERRINLEKVTVAELLTGWLGDLQQDRIVAITDEASGHPPRAICLEAKDSLPNALGRWMKEDEPFPGG